jgi:protein translocase SecG subunit
MNYITLAQVVIAISLMVAILVQNRGGGLSGVFGGGGSNVYMTKRGFEKKLFYLTIVLAVMFFAVSLLNFFINI